MKKYGVGSVLRQAAPGGLGVRRVGFLGLTVLALAVGSVLARSGKQLPPQAAADMVGSPQTLGMGISETVDAIMKRQAKTPPAWGRLRRADRGTGNMIFLEDPKAPAVSQWPPASDEGTPVGPLPSNPQAVGTGFLAVSLSPPTFPESGSIPPDSMGDVGPSQILVTVNGRIKVFDKTGVVGALNSDLDVFFDSVRNAVGTTDPEVRRKGKEDQISKNKTRKIKNIPCKNFNDR